MTLSEAFDFALNLKEKLVNSTTKRGYENRIKNFLIWVKETHPKLKRIKALDKRVMVTFLNDVLDRTSARNRNNYRTDLV